MSKADLAVGNRLDALRQAMKVLADRNQVGRRSARQVAVEAHPVDRSGVALDVVLVRAGKITRQGARLQVEKIPLMDYTLELFTDLPTGERRLQVLRREHRNIIPNRCSMSSLESINFDSNPTPQ